MGLRDLRPRKSERAKESLSRSDSHRWILVDVDQVVSSFETDSDSGLGSEQVAQLLKEYGKNSLEVQGSYRQTLKALVNPLLDVTHWILILLGLIEIIILKSPFDGAIFLLIAFINIGTAYTEAFQVIKLLRKLQKTSRINALVIRDGSKKVICSWDIVPGDIVILSAGDTVPADIRLIQVSDLKVSELSFTGESKSISKTSSALDITSKEVHNRRNMVFATTTIVAGSAKGVVVYTGKNMQVSKISKGIMSSSYRERTKLGKAIMEMYVVLLTLILIICFGYYAFVRFDVKKGALDFMLAIVASSLPAGLSMLLVAVPAVVSRRMLKNKIMVSRLSSVEMSGYVDVIFSDKTGTLTIATMQVVCAWSEDQGFISVPYLPPGSTGNIYKTSTCVTGERSDIEIPIENAPETLKFIAVISAQCNSSLVNNEEKLSFFGDPTDVSLNIFARRFNVSKEMLLKSGWIIRKEYAFESRRKIMSLLATSPENVNYILSKGAPEIILSACNLKDSNEACTEMEKLALRVLGYAYRIISASEMEDLILKNDIEENMTFLGLVGIQDPIREGARETISELGKYQIPVCIMTGDAEITALEIAKKAGVLGGNSPENRGAFSGSVIDNIPDEELDRMDIPSVIYRCTPSTKLKLVLSAKRRKLSPLMIGDGFNDAASIKAASVGISMGKTSVDIARASADMVLLDDNFRSLVEIIINGRTLCLRMRYFIMLYFIFVLSTLILVILSLINTIPDEFWFPIITNATIMTSYIISTFPTLWQFFLDFQEEMIVRPLKGVNAVYFTKEMIADILVNSILFCATVAPLFFIRLYRHGIERSKVECDSVRNIYCFMLFKARSLTFLAYNTCIIFHGLHARAFRKSSWTRTALLEVKRCTYPIVLNLLAFLFAVIVSVSGGKLIFSLYKHIAISWEVVIVGIAMILNVLAVELYKYIKRKKFGDILI